MASRESRDTGIHVEMKTGAGVIQPNPRYKMGFWQPSGSKQEMEGMGQEGTKLVNALIFFHP